MSCRRLYGLRDLVAASATPLVLAILAESERCGCAISRAQLATQRQQWQVMDVTLRGIWMKARTA